MRLLDSRRLRGPNLQTPGPAALAEVAFDEGEDPARAVDVWRAEVARMTAALGWKEAAGEARARVFRGGAALTFPAPIDVLLAATEVNEWAIASATAILAGAAPAPLGEELARIGAEVAAQRQPRLLALREAAAARGVPFLWDDDAITLGMAARSRTYPVDALPVPGTVPWEELGRIPVALITGTNGKTTSTRLVARIARLAGLRPGHTSTDGVAIDEELIERGDWTGPGAARMVLRRPEVTIAILETARGGLLRRGLAVDACDAALITNVSSDHLGEFGIDDLDAMARTKAVVTRVVRDDGRVVLNADDPHLVPLAKGIAAPVIYFGLDAANAVIAAHVASGETAYVVRDGQFTRLDGGGATALGSVVEAPLTFRGAAKYNVQNCLGAAALAFALGLPDEAVRAALATFGARAEDNPGRGMIFDRGGVRVLADFGHNPDGMRGVFALAQKLRAERGGRLIAVSAQAGDRSDEDLRALAREIAAAEPARVILWDLISLLRGRAPGEVPAILQRELVAAGLPAESIGFADHEVDALQRALAQASPGDLVTLMPHIDREGIRLALAG